MNLRISVRSADRQGARLRTSARIRAGYTYPLSKIFRRVVAFEINDEITGWIRDYNRGNIELIHRGLSSSAGMARFYVPVTRGVGAGGGWGGSLYADNLPDAESCIEKEVLVSLSGQFWKSPASASSRST